MIQITAEEVAATAHCVIAVTGVVAVVFAIFELSQKRQSDKIRHLLEKEREFERDPIARWRRVCAEKRLKGEEFPSEGQDLLNFFETIGLLVRRKFLDEHDVWSCFGYWMFNVYADLRDGIEQEQRDDGSYYLDFCNLIERLRKIEIEEGGQGDRPSKDEIREFWEDEAKVSDGQPVRKKARKRKPKSTGDDKPKDNKPQ
jgi:hypothetical protein